MPARKRPPATAAPPEAAVAATDLRQRPRRRRRFLRELPWIAAGVGALAARDAHGQSSVDTRFLFYKESGGRTEVLNPLLRLHEDFGDTYGHADLILGYDAISGASPTGAYPTADVTTSASGHLIAAGNFPQAQYKDSRKSASLSYGRKFGANLPSIDISYAKENDYIARGAGFTDEWTFAHGRGTLHFGVALSRDTVIPVTNHLHFPKSENGYSLGWTWILDERDLIDVSASLMQLSGYLDDPYKVVPIGPPGTTNALPEHRPGSRSRRAVVIKYGHHYLGDSAIKLTYRYYNDDWSVQAHLLEVEYDYRLSENWIVAPRVRLYTQTGASFYASRLVQAQTFMSADYRLSPLDSILGGLTITYKINDSLSANVGAALQQQWGRDRVTPTITSPLGANVGSVSAADMNVTTITFGLTKLF
jgi:Protein of unknown function (DUF3570)